MPTPTDIKLRRRSRLLEIAFDDGIRFALPFEYLRVFSPSAEVRGHAGDDMKLVAGKRAVNIKGVQPAGNYALRLLFDDGHDSGLYSWRLLRSLGERQQANWEHYLARLKNAGLSRTTVNL